MKPRDKQRVRELIGLWISYQDKLTHIREIAESGPTQGQKMIELKGEFPQITKAKPEILVSKVDKMRKYVFSEDERYANAMISKFPDKQRRILTGYEEKRNQHNSITGKPWTHEDIAFVLKLRFDRYQKLRLKLMEILIEADKTRHVVVKKQMDTTCSI